VIAKRVQKKKGASNFARLARYVVDARGGVDPSTWKRTADYILDASHGGETARAPMTRIEFARPRIMNITSRPVGAALSSCASLVDSGQRRVSRSNDEPVT
jgi:hypothetical protein